MILHPKPSRKRKASHDIMGTKVLNNEMDPKKKILYYDNKETKKRGKIQYTVLLGLTLKNEQRY